MSVSIRAYRMRILNTLIADDVKLFMAKVGFTSYGDLVEDRAMIINSWNAEVETEIFKIIKKRLKGK